VKVNTDCSLGHRDQPLDLYKETRSMLRRHRIFPKKRLGQNFTIDYSLLQLMISYADLTANDTVLEVGAGFGYLTSLLAKRAKKVIAVEMDSTLAAVLRERLSDLPNVETLEGDILTANISAFDKVVSTPPYSISSQLLFWLLDKPFKLAVLAFQEEFARRLTANVGSKDYSRLTVNTYYKADVETLDHVSKNCFYPPPDVDSTIVRIKPKPKPFRVEDEKTFSGLVQAAFTQRNKKLRNAVRPFLHRYNVPRAIAQAMADSLTFHDKRVRELAPEDFGAVANEIIEKTRHLR
jgi:16S rRNA (adenine1518-N6/adenine1519-N6)-dimethyltransferase